MPSEEIVTPSCIAAMKRGGSAVIRSTARAPRLPSCSSSMIRVRRDVTRPYSAATKNAFRSSRPTRASISSRKVMRRFPARAYWAAVRRPRESSGEYNGESRRYEHMFYDPVMRVEYREEPCRVALNRVKGMPFDWSLNPYMGCVHRCTFCYVRAFEHRADRPSDNRYGSSIRVKTNVADVLRQRARPPELERRADRDRRRDRPVPAGRGPVPPDARLRRGAARTRARRSRSSPEAR